MANPSSRLASRIVSSFALVTLSVLACAEVQGRTCREIWVRPGPAGGEGTRARPYGSLQEAVDKHGEDWGQVFLCPGVYKGDVVIARDALWFFPALQYDVVVEGSITVRGKGVILRGLTFRARDRAIVVAPSATGCTLQHNRVLGLADGGVGIQIESDASVYGNVVDLRKAPAKDAVGIRVVTPSSGAGPRLDHNRVAGVDQGIVIEGSETSTATQSAAVVTHVTNSAVSACRVGLTVGAPDAVAKYNTITGCSGAGLLASGRRCRIDANTIHGNAGRGLCVSGTDVRAFNNVVYGNASVGALADAGAVNVTLCYNTFSANGPDGALSIKASGGTSGRIAANILSGSGALLAVAGQWELTGNLLSHKAAAATGQGTIIGDPRFAAADRGDFRLRQGSPAIAAALPSKDVWQDRNGVGRPTSARTDIGAYAVPQAPQTRRTIHVSASAGPNGSGSATRPLSTIAQAVRNLEPGDTVVVADGTYTESLTIARSGTPGWPIVVRSRTPGDARFIASRISLDDCTHVRVEGLRFVISPGGVRLGPNVRRCVVAGCRFETQKGKASSTVSVSGPAASHNVVEDCTFVGAGRKQVAIQLSCQRWNQHAIVRRCAISGYYYAVQTGGGSYPTAPPGYHIVEDCELFANKDGVHAKMTDGIIRNNHLHHNTGHGITTRYGARHLIEGNRIHHNGHGIRLHSPSHLVRDNVIAANKHGGIVLSVFMGEPYYEPPRSTFIVNNTFWGHAKPTIRIEQGARCAILRNIIVGASPNAWLILREDSGNKSPGEMSGAIRLADFNLYHRGRVPLLREYEGGEYDVYADPMFVAPEKDDFSLADDSPARNAVPADWTALPPIPFGADADPRRRTLGADQDVAKPGRSYGPHE